MKKKIIFVDCFNTILGRRVTPNDVLLDFVKQLADIYHLDYRILFNHIYQTIIKLEQQILSKQKYEYTFEEIVTVVYQLNNALKDKTTLDAFLKQAIALYAKCEIKTHYIKQNVVKYLKRLKEAGARIYLVSDFCLGKVYIMDWLKRASHNDINESFFTDVFVSCDINKSKRSKTIYPYLLKHLNYEAKDVMMIGDNYQVDIKNAKHFGIKGHLVKPQMRLDSSEVRKLKKSNNINIEYLDIFYTHDQYRYSNYAFPLYLFIKKLGERVNNEHISDILFFAREGEFLKRLFDEYIKNKNIVVNTHYFLISRAASYVSALKPIKEQDFSTITSHPFLRTIDFLMSLGFDEKTSKEIMHNVHIGQYHRHYLNYEKSHAFKKLMNSPYFQNIYEQMRVDTQKNFQSYFNSFPLQLNKGLYIVDVGWKGSSQNFLYQYLKKQVNTKGYYVGLNRHSDNSDVHNLKEGLTFHLSNHNNKMAKILSYRMFRYEQVLRSWHSYCHGYSKANIEETNSVNSFEYDVYHKYIKSLQDDIAFKVQAIMKIDEINHDFDDLTAMKMFYLMNKKTRLSDYLHLAKIERYHYDAFIRSGFTLRGIAYLKLPVTFIMDKIFAIKYRRFKPKR